MRSENRPSQGLWCAVRTINVLIYSTIVLPGTVLKIAAQQSINRLLLIVSRNRRLRNDDTNHQPLTTTVE